MATTVTTSTSTTSTSGGRHTGVTSTGVDWVMHYNLANTRMEFRYSSDDGATWTEATSLRVTLAANRAERHEFYIGEHDRACFASCGAGGYVAQFTPLLTTTATWTSLTSNTTQDTDNIRVRVFDYGALSGTPVYCVLLFEVNVGGELDWWSYMRRVSNNTAYSEQRVAFNGFSDTAFDFDFQHNGDGKTAVTNPAIFVAHRKNGTQDRTWIQKRAWNGTQRGWSTTTSARTMSTTGHASTDALAAVFDGSRFIVSAIDDGSDTLPKWWERNAADTETTTRTVAALSDGAVTSLSLSFDGNTDARLYAVGASSNDVKRVTFDRSAGTFGSWELIEATIARSGQMSVQPGFQGDGINVVWSTPGTSPYTITFERDPFNRAPNAPMWQIDNNQPINSVIHSYGWTFNDPDDGDVQSAFALRRTINGGTAEYWNAGTQLWGASETKNVSSVTGTGENSAVGVSDGDVVVARVKTWDAADAQGPYSTSLTRYASTPVTPSVTAPTGDEVIATNTVTIGWTASEQTAFEVRLSDGPVVLYSSGKVTDSDSRSFELPYVLADGFAGFVDVSVWNDDNLVGPRAGVDFSVNYVPPATPTLVVTADDANGRISVVVTDPAPSGDPIQPTVTSRDLFVRVAAGGRAVGERTTDTDGIRIAANQLESTLHDYAAPSGVALEYMVRANGDNGTSSDSAWTA